MHCKKPLSAAIACVLFMLAGCDRSTESGNYRLTLSPSLGKIKNAAVRVYAADGKTLVGKGNTGETGAVGMYHTGSEPPLIVTVLGDDDATYYDEFLQADVSFPAGSSMRAVIPTLYGNYGVSPLTELAYRIALDQQLFPLTVREVNTLNERIRSSLSPELASIVSVPTIIDGSVLSGSLDDTEANRYAVRLAAMAELGASEARPALAVMNALGRDILDGVIDDTDKNSDPLATPYDPVTLVNDTDVALGNMAAEYGLPDLVSAVATYPQISLNIDIANISDGSNFTGCSDEPLPVPLLPVEIRGRIVNMKFESVDGASPYAQDEVVRFAFCADDQLRITNDYYVVADVPVVVVVDGLNTTYTWKQNSNSVLYELVALNNTIYEVNVYGESGASYFGRFVLY